MGLFGIFTKSGKYMHCIYDGTKKQANTWAKNHYIKGSFKVKPIKPKRRKK